MSVSAWRKVLCTGVFDILHRGHVEMLEHAKTYGGALIVGVNSDKAVRALKGPARPVNNENDRCFMLTSLRCVDTAFVIDDVTVEKAILELKPDVWCKGGDYTLQTLNKDEVAAARAVGAEIVLIPMTNGYSTTKTLEKLKC